MGKPHRVVQPEANTVNFA